MPLHDASAYMTYWYVYCIVAAYAAVGVARVVPALRQYAAPLAGFIVTASCLVGVMGAEVVSNRMRLAPSELLLTLRSHVFLHVLPLYGALLLIAFWRVAVGRRLSVRAATCSLAATMVIFLVWCMTPTNDPMMATWGLKITHVYHVTFPFTYVCAGVLVATLGAVAATFASRGVASLPGLPSALGEEGECEKTR